MMSQKTAPDHTVNLLNKEFLLETSPNAEFFTFAFFYFLIQRTKLWDLSEVVFLLKWKMSEFASMFGVYFLQGSCRSYNKAF